MPIEDGSGVAGGGVAAKTDPQRGVFLVVNGISGVVGVGGAAS